MLFIYPTRSSHPPIVANVAAPLQLIPMSFLLLIHSTPFVIQRQDSIPLASLSSILFHGYSPLKPFLNLIPWRDDSVLLPSCRPITVDHSPIVLSHFALSGDISSRPFQTISPHCRRSMQRRLSQPYYLTTTTSPVSIKLSHLFGRPVIHGLCAAPLANMP